ncbi:MAG TPA: hypothetical protein VFU06_04785 [Longimicrobiales bacterium]|nr:hypothetical protein [Longimicrobiales bacterium]
MKQYRIGRIAATAVLMLGALAVTGCLGDNDPVDVDVNDGHVIGVGLRVAQQHFNVAAFAEDSENTDLLTLTDSISTHAEAQFDAFLDLDITVRETTLSQAIARQTSDIANLLSIYTGEEFDRQYVQVLVDLYEQNIGIIDEDLLTAVESPELEAELQALRATLVAEQLEVIALQTEIGPPES